MNITFWFILLAIVIIVGYDIYAYLRFGDPGTISGVIDHFSNTFKVVVFASGFIAGHLFWNMHICP